MLATQQKQEQQRTKREAVTELASMRDEPRALMQKAVDIVKQYTSAGAAYAANVAEQEEPDWVPPEDDEAAQAESDDEAEPTPPTDLPEGEEEAAALAEPPAEVPVEGDPPAEDGTPAPPRPIDYSKKYLSYIVATAGQEFVPSPELIRPPPPPEDDSEAKVDLPAYTFRILDEKMPMVFVPNVAYDPRINFFRQFPKIGSYQACGVQMSSGEFKAVMCVDTLFPEAGGQPLSQEDQDFIWEVSLALSKAYEAVEKQTKEEVGAASAAELLTSLNKKVLDIYFPPPSEEDGEAGAGTGAAGGVAGSSFRF